MSEPRSDISIVPYRAATHSAFVHGTFADSLRDCPIWSAGAQTHIDVLSRVLRDPSVKAIVSIPTGHEDELLGWAVAFNGALVFCYVRYVVRRRGVLTHMMQKLQLTSPTPVIYWTRACSKLAASGHPIYCDVDALENTSKLVR